MEKSDKSYLASVSESESYYLASVWKSRTKVTWLQYGKVGQKLLGFSIEISDKISISLFSGLCWTETPICNWGIANESVKGIPAPHDRRDFSDPKAAAAALTAPAGSTSAFAVLLKIRG